jgi:hypothetical protein
LPGSGCSAGTSSLGRIGRVSHCAAKVKNHQTAAGGQGGANLSAAASGFRDER